MGGAIQVIGVFRSLGGAHLSGTARDSSNGINIMGSVILGDGVDKITGISKNLAGSNGGFGVQNKGIIEMGGGNDVLIGESKADSFMAIWNSGLINMGKGNDIVNAYNGGLSGGGYIEFGAGENTLLGYGDMHVDGGGNAKSKLVLNPGTYTLAKQSGVYSSTGCFLVSLPVGIDGGSMSMLVDGFGIVKGIAGPASGLPLRAGVLQITASGVASYL